MTDEQLRELIASIAVIQKENALAHKETERQFKEIALAQKETDRQLKENALVQKEITLIQKETDRQLKENALAQKENERQFKENALAQKETDRQFKETRRQLKELGIQIGGIGNKFGSFTEGMAFPAMEKILRKEFGLETISTNTKVQKGDRELELDVLGYSNGEANKVVVVEVKSHLTEKGIQQVLKTLAEFPEFFPELAKKQVYGMIATVAASKEVKQKVFEAGLYLGMIHDEQFKLAKSAHFTPRCFS